MNSPFDPSQFSSAFEGMIFCPVVSREKFSEITGIPEGVIRGWIQLGYLDMFPIGKRNLINLALLQKRALEKEFS